MYFKSLDYPIVIIDADYESPRIAGILIRALAEELRKSDQRVLSGLNLDDARAGARTYVAASAVLISIDGTEDDDDQFQRLLAFLREQSQRRADLPVFLYGERRTTGWLSGAAVMVKRSVNDEVGGWDEGYFLHFEDIDLGYRIGLAGHTNVFEPSATVSHSGGHSLKKLSAMVERAMTASAIRFMRKRYAGFWRSPIRWIVVAALRVRGVLKSRTA